MIKYREPLSMTESLEYIDDVKDKESEKESEGDIKKFIKKFVKLKPEEAKKLRDSYRYSLYIHLFSHTK